MFDLYFNENTSSTIWLYTFIGFSSLLFGGLSDRYGELNNLKSLFWFFVSYLFLLVFYALNEIGVDTISYKMIFSSFVNLSDCTKDSEFEYGYQLLNVFVHFFTQNPKFGVSIIRTIQLSLVFYSFYLLRNKISQSFSIYAYVTLLYFLPFNILRMGIAFSLAMVAYALYLRGKLFIAIIVCFSCYSIHRTSFIFIVAFILILMVEKFRLVENEYNLYRLSFLYIVMSWLCIDNVLTNIDFSSFGNGRYEHYFNNNTSTPIGLGLIFYFYPILFFMIKSYYDSIQLDKSWWASNFTLLIMGIFAYLLGYRISILSRCNNYFFIPYIFFISYVYKNYQSITIRFCNITISKNMILCFFVIFFWCVFLMECSQVLFVTSGLENFSFMDF